MSWRAGWGLILMVTAGIFVSCSSQQQRHRVTSWEQQRVRQLELDSAQVAFWARRQGLRLSQTGQQVMILPQGPFSFRPDSGFQGEAAFVLLERWSESGSLLSDSVFGSGVWHRESRWSDSSDRFDASDELAVSRTAGFQFGSGRGWWWRLGVLCAAVVAARLALLRFRFR